MLDVEYEAPNFDYPAGDSNHYTFGRIGEHNVVIVSLPQGVCGTHSAAAVASGLGLSFSCLGFLLMVVVAGAAPISQNYIRLGDIVVSERVMPYKFDKQYPGGYKFTGDVFVSDHALLSATCQVQSDLDLDILKLDSIISKRFNGPKKLRDMFQRRESDPILFFQSDYLHLDSCDCLHDHPQKQNIVRRSKRKAYERIKVYSGKTLWSKMPKSVTNWPKIGTFFALRWNQPHSGFEFHTLQFEQFVTMPTLTKTNSGKGMLPLMRQPVPMLYSTSPP
ncbi:hypothetical protein N7508_004605 [Penicillium antarcticum]|uniref:uncharacterized protein n=1 Tax=Penicillium antarcticum TaxID=416450 RepID=UPI00239E2B7E|nr:uncharacterized protein N7508_004605 [Penicillium antarcticum]KAJ5309226.1 hypothetical protein N7508_004605 [Penicillium antarcticum]